MRVTCLVAPSLPLFRRTAYLAAVGGKSSSPQPRVSVSTMASLARSAAAGLRRALMAGGAGRGALAALQQPGEQWLGGPVPDRLPLPASERPAPRTAPDRVRLANRRHRRAAFTSLPAGGGRPALAAARILGAQLHTVPSTRAAEAATQPIMDNVRGMIVSVSRMTNCGQRCRVLHPCLSRACSPQMMGQPGTLPLCHHPLLQAMVSGHAARLGRSMCMSGMAGAMQQNAVHVGHDPAPAQLPSPPTFPAPHPRPLASTSSATNVSGPFNTLPFQFKRWC